MPKQSQARQKPGPPRTPKTATEKALADLKTATAAERRRISSKDRRFVSLFVDGGMKDAEGAAAEAGFKEPRAGEKLSLRLSHLIESERRRRALGEQMEVDEALRLLAEVARETVDRKVQHSALRTVLQVHGILSDKALPEDRRTAARQVEDLVEAIKKAVGKRGRAGVEAIDVTPVTLIEGVHADHDSPGPAKP